MNKTIPFNINHTLAGHDMGFGNSASRALMQGNDIYEEKVDHPSHYNSGIKKAIWYLQRHLENLRNKSNE